MAEFSPELEDGERWLPANILNDVGVRRRPSPLPFPASSDGRECLPRLAYLQALALELASLGPFHRHDVSTSPVFPPSPHYFVFGVPPARSVNNAVRSGAVRDSFMPAGVGGGCASLTPRLRSVQMRMGSDRFPPPLQSHCSAFCEDIDLRKRAFGASKTGTMHRPAPSIRGQFASIPTPGPARENAGTGVFIPRVKIEKVNAARDVTGCREQSEKEASSNGPEKERVKLKPLPHPIEHGLPRDWTY
ncbi:uncharacterized protein LOC122022316 [Zingiber officinale]|uniref:uncharacterized protein LOC122022316 n=1 Tax=Zingiber officinale TaxID=94328 RepID=UPI001C4DA72F|nr:uncharacterized protein LOC122022316 [Zingiber officinale]